MENETNIKETKLTPAFIYELVEQGKSPLVLVQYCKTISAYNTALRCYKNIKRAIINS